MNIRKELPRPARPGEPVALDIEMFGQEVTRLHRPHGTFACISVSYSEDEVYQIYDTADLPELFERVQAGEWVFHNALYDLSQLKKWVSFTPTYIHDTMLYEQGLWGGYYDTYSLKDLARRYLSIYMEKETREQFENRTEMDPVMQEYAALDAVMTLRVREAQLALPRPEMAQVYRIDADMIWVILDMRPIKVDAKRWYHLAEDFESRAVDIQEELGFNVKSIPQVQAALRKIGLKLPNTQAESLKPFASMPLVAKIMECRHYRDAVSKYGYGWLEQNLEEGDLVYPNWKIRGAETGRMSCQRPNMQNIPTRELPIYREFIIPQFGILGDWDISQQEPRITCKLSGDKNLLGAFLSKEDIHLYVTRSIYADPSIEKHDPRRKIGKSINLGLTYGLTAGGLAERTGMSLGEAQQIIRKYFDRFPGVENYVNRMRNMAFTRGYIKTALGARIYVNPYNYQWQNNAINAPVQGGAAEFTKRWGYLTWERERAEGLPFTINAFIHDETLHDIEPEITQQVDRIVEETFQQTAEEQYPGVPFEKEGGFGPNWRTAKPE